MTTPETSTANEAGRGRSWVSFIAEDGDTWLFDLSFFSSRWHCIYGQGCQGIEEVPNPEAARGCCSHGAHFVDEEDLGRVMTVAAALDADVWQNHSLFPELGASEVTLADTVDALTVLDEDGDRITKVIDGACVFLNDASATTGAGCAFHFAAVRAELDPLVWKPEVCWQVPIRVEHHVDDNDQHTHLVRQWTRADWGEGGADLGWWCSEAPEAYTAKVPTAQVLRGEIAALAGEAVADALIEHVLGNATVVALPL